MKTEWPQLLILGLMCLELGMVMAKHGSARPPYNIGVTLIASLLFGSILYAGGFFG